MENLTPPANGKMPPPWPCRISSRPAPTTQAQSDTRTTRAAALGFFFLPCLHACPACRISTPARAGCCWQPPRGKAGKYPGSAGHSTRILRPPPAPGRISTASAATDDPASSRPPPTMTTHQRQPRPACTAPTACQPCQTSQQQRSRQRRPPGRTSPPAPPTCRRLHRCRLLDDPPRSTPQNGHFAPPPEGSDSPPNGIEL